MKAYEMHQNAPYPGLILLKFSFLEGAQHLYICYPVEKEKPLTTANWP